MRATGGRGREARTKIICRHARADPGRWRRVAGPVRAPSVPVEGLTRGPWGDGTRGAPEAVYVAPRGRNGAWPVRAPRRPVGASEAVLGTPTPRGAVGP